jgi:hypothetical protein
MKTKREEDAVKIYVINVFQLTSCVAFPQSAKCKDGRFKKVRGKSLVQNTQPIAAF